MGGLRSGPSPQESRAPVMETVGLESPGARTGQTDRPQPLCPLGQLPDLPRAREVTLGTAASPEPITTHPTGSHSGQDPRDGNCSYLRASTSS